ncbi:hypothetical protein PHYSODRAFT_306135 [Phytophthora sojae]|uniref:Uncharacterized protein n=1 Tax=Phytophthora sojae (strain P6497) TaxID=1094619 RepID=G5A808_PHYSP|nr:hypothetical protein PHYSODRAFT_306135 [Phytophthora sojae]EGZ08034.1 hypothetical protein PHYSODRAFT_306135 [Phytophthora sojae]|eukprot:XP_009536206.1 hypothetical protein PHYSODRAFT_306135 [Phytophthora sojae]
MAAVPAIQGIGFTTSGIAANSVAAGLMSSAAIGAGGGVASGSTVAVLQGIGAAGTVPLGIAAATVAVPTVIGLGVGGVFLTAFTRTSWTPQAHTSSMMPMKPAGLLPSRRALTTFACFGTTMRATLVSGSRRAGRFGFSTVPTARSLLVVGTAGRMQRFVAS